MPNPAETTARAAKSKKAQGAPVFRAGPQAGADEGPRNILLFSDGTGNSSAKLQKTNVWRFYEALDLGYPVAETEPVQIAYYDNGVGTSSIQLLAVLGGIFGFGLARNIRDIYKFLCRNYRPGDRIYAFGFSRGAYTIRLLVAFVTRMGLVDYDQNEARNEARLDFAARDNWREFRRSFHANFFFADLLVGLGRWALRWAIWIKRKLLRQPGYASLVRGERRNWLAEWWEHTADRLIGWWTGTPPIRDQTEYGPEIEFVGVWDTVAAYGGPVVEVTRAIDEWIWPLTMPDYRLSQRVKRARHALAIDDKRDSFTPLLWDEVEDAKHGHFDPANPRLQQVWFAGMHADVGGGYADESLSYVSLWWMMEHAELAGPGGKGVRFLADPRKRIETFRNVYGPLHDSRGGAGAFYRYQPRYINAWVEGRPGKTRILEASRIFRDPTIDHGRYRDHGLLNFPVRLHISVQERLQVATDGYAPNNLPARYLVDDGPRPAQCSAARLLDKQELENFKDGQLQLGDRIKLRRFWYFASALVFTLLVLKPFWPHIWLLDWLVGSIDARTDAHRLEQAANAFLPDMAKTWTAAIAADPFVSLATLGLVVLTARLGMAQEGAMSDLAGRMWRARLDPAGFVQPPKRPGLVSRLPFLLARQFHTRNGLAKLLAWLKWRAVPVVLGFAIWVFNWYVALFAAAQAYLVPREALPSTCPAGQAQVEIDPRALAWIFREPDEQTGSVDIANPCGDTPIKVSPGKRYRVIIDTFDVQGKPGGWLDAGQPATPAGWTSDSLRTQLKLGFSKPFQRITNAGLMQPVFETRAGFEIWPLDDIYMMRPDLKQTAKYRWEGHFELPKARREQDDDALPLYFFVNDAVFPFDRMASGQERPTESYSELGEKICSEAKGGARVPITLGGRYRNNCGKAVIRVMEDPYEKPDE